MSCNANQPKLVGPLRGEVAPDEVSSHTGGPGVFPFFLRALPLADMKPDWLHNLRAV